jgi:hypothetical protein
MGIGALAGFGTLAAGLTTIILPNFVFGKEGQIGEGHLASASTYANPGKLFDLYKDDFTNAFTSGFKAAAVGPGGEEELENYNESVKERVARNNVLKADAGNRIWAGIQQIGLTALGMAPTAAAFLPGPLKLLALAAPFTTLGAGTLGALQGLRLDAAHEVKRQVMNNGAVALDTIYSQYRPYLQAAKFINDNSERSELAVLAKLETYTDKQIAEDIIPILGLRLESARNGIRTTAETLSSLPLIGELISGFGNTVANLIPEQDLRIKGAIA